MAETVKSVDVLVVGSGASGLTAAVTARIAGLKVLLVEKADVFGGTTAVSGGQLWVPGNHHAKDSGHHDSRAAVTAYLREEMGNYDDPDRIAAFLDHGPEMLRFIETHTRARFGASLYPDYHSERENASLVRSVRTLEGDAAEIDRDLLKRIKPILPQTVFAGIAVGSSVEVKQLMKAGSSIGGMTFLIGRLVQHWKHLLRYGRGEPVVRGRALVARLAQSCRDVGVEMWHAAKVSTLTQADGRVTGAVIQHQGKQIRIEARRAVVLAAGGFTKDAMRTQARFAHVAAGKDHAAPTADSNHGDGIRLAEKAGGVFSAAVAQPGAWVPVSVIPGRKGAHAVFPHLIDRQKPGFIAVNARGRRFTNESGPYHDFVSDLLRDTAADADSGCWLIADRPAFRKYGMGFVKPAPVPYAAHLRSGYIRSGKTLQDLAKTCGIDAANLRQTIDSFNRNARLGLDPDFRRGQSPYDAYQGDDAHQPNACLGPLETGPFFAVRLVPGDLGTFAGLTTDRFSRALDADNRPIPGLYAVGNDQRSVFGGFYPGPGSTLGPGMTFSYIAARHIAGQLT